MGRACFSLSSCFEDVPVEIRLWKPEHAPQATVMNRAGNRLPIFVDQPVNVCQVFPNVLIVNHVDSVHFTPFIGDIVHDVFPFPLNIILYVFSVVNGVISTSFAGIANHV